jgi:hypothetical protein
MTDQELLISTIRKAGQIIGKYIEPGPRDAEQTLTQLIAVLETPFGELMIAVADFQYDP